MDNNKDVMEVTNMIEKKKNSSRELKGKVEGIKAK